MKASFCFEEKKYQGDGFFNIMKFIRFYGGNVTNTEAVRPAGL